MRKDYQNSQSNNELKRSWDAEKGGCSQARASRDAGNDQIRTSWTGNAAVSSILMCWRSETNHKEMVERKYCQITYQVC